MDENALMAFVGKAVTDVGAVLNGSMVVLGDRLGLYRAMAGGGAVSTSELAQRTGLHERYVREWLAAQAASGYVRLEEDGRYLLPEEHALALTDETSAACVIGAFQTAVGAVHATDRVGEAFRSGGGLAWGDQHVDVLVGCERFFRPGYLNALTSAWIPAMDGVEEALRAGTQVADVGCGHGASTLLMAKAYPASTFVGFDGHEGSIDVARKRAAEAGLADRVRFEVGTAQAFPGEYGLVTMFDCLHDMGDPSGACRHVLETLREGGRMLLVEPFAGDAVADNLNPVGAAYYGFSTLLCTPNAMVQPGSPALGAQAGEQRLREVVVGAGFGDLRRVAETPFNLVLQATP